MDSSSTAKEVSVVAETPVMETRNLFIHYGSKLAIRNASLKISERKVTSIIGPSGCGKSTLLRALNRMNDFIDGLRVEGQVLYRGQNVYERGVDPVLIRKKVGMVFQRPNPFPKSISKNITWGPKIHGMPGPYSEVVEESLRVTALWDEVKDRLNDSAMSLSGGQQQRLCIARAIAMKPDVILMDEPCSALDPRSTSRIEDLIGEMKKDYTIIIVTHNMQQAARISDETLFMCDGVLVESGPTSKIFTNPTHKETEDYITGRFG